MTHWKNALRACVFAAASILGVARAPERPQVIEGQAERVADGDTLTVRDTQDQTHRIRLLGIDAPELSQPYGKVPRQILRDRLQRKRVKVYVQSKDRYGRTVGKVMVDGVDLNLELVREGMAWHYTSYADDQFPGDARRYAQAEKEARAARRGLWSQASPEAPWVWRKQHPR